VRAAAEYESGACRGRAGATQFTTQFTCFTSTKVQILTPDAHDAQAAGDAQEELAEAEGGGESEEGAGEGAEGWGMRVADRHEAIQVLRLLALLVQECKY
jgi:hypothetical protein